VSIPDSPEGWVALADDLLGDDPQTDGALARNIAPELLRFGRLSGLHAALAGFPDRPRSHVLAVLEAEAAARLVLVDDADLEKLAGRLAEEHAADDVLAWLDVTRSQLGLLVGDLPAILRVLVSAELQGSGFIARYTRARGLVCRGAVAMLVAGSANDAAANASVSEAVAGLRDLGCFEEEQWTRLAIGAFAVLLSYYPSDIAEVEAAFGALKQTGSDRLGQACAILASLRLMAGDVPGSQAFIADLFRVVPPDHPRRWWGRGLELIASLDAQGATPECLDEIEAVLVGETDLGIRRWLYEVGVNVLLDHGATEVVSRVGITDAAPSPFTEARRAREVQAVRARLRILTAADPESAAEIAAIVDAHEADGNLVWAARLALRGAGDCKRAGLDDTASALAERGRRLLDRAVPPDKRVFRDVALLEGRQIALSPTRPRPNEIRLFGPRPVVVRDGAQLELSPMSEMLLTVLVGARSAVTQDWAMTALWPDVDYQTGRNRLNMAVRRLRRQLGPGAEDVVRRDASGIRLDLAGWRVDLWDFLDGSAGVDAQRLSALRAMKALPCEAYAGNDAVDELRDRVAQTWSALADHLVERGLVTVAEVERMRKEIGSL
jgi:hypothetical protein